MLRTFTFSRSFYLAGQLIVLCSGFLLIIALVVGIFNYNEVAWQALPILAVSIGFFLAIGLYFRNRHRGFVQLDEQGVTVTRGKKVSSIAYDDIEHVIEFDRNLPPGMVLISPRGRLSFSRMLTGFEEFYSLLGQRIGLLDKDNVGTFSFSARKYYMVNSLGVAVFFYLLFGLITVYILVVHGQKEILKGFAFMMGFATFFGLIGAAVGIPWGKKVVTLKATEVGLTLQTYFFKDYNIPREKITAIEQKVEKISVKGISRDVYSVTIKTSLGDFTVTEQAARAFKTGVPRLTIMLQNWLQSN